MPEKMRNKISKANIARFVVLLALVGTIVALAIIFWPELRKIAEPDGMQELIGQIRASGPWGPLVLFGIQIIQVMLGFVPSEVIAIITGIIYGPWLGTLIVIGGCAVGTTIVFLIVRKLGAPFVRSIVPEKLIRRINRFEQSERFYLIVFILFLIPGIPKDVVTYIVPLSSIGLGPFVAVATLGRLPEMFAVVYAAHDIANGNYIQAILIFAVTAVIAIVGVLIYNRTIGRDKAEATDNKVK